MLKRYFRWLIPLWHVVRKYRFRYKCYITNRYYKAKLRQLSHKEEPIVSVFLATFPSTWKYDSLYKLMLDDPRFKPIILVCPIINSGYDNMLRYMEESFNMFKNKNYRVIKAYNQETNKYIDLRKELRPDILFYTNPYKGLIDDRYYINKNNDMLTVYVSYNFNNGKAFDYFYDLDFHNLVWRHYAETELHRQYAIDNARNHGRNVVVTGYPGIESYLAHYTCKNNIDDSKESVQKLIIWAPHHTLEKGPYGHTCFLKYYDFMVEIAHKYEKEIRFVFKPHPLLKARLYDKWGKIRTDEYYSLWANMPNTSINDGDYEDLFLQSDAMIHDSGSFAVEYLYVNKPVMRTVYDVGINEQFNSFGIMCLNQHYLGYNEADIELFIQNVIKGIDPLKQQRTEFISDVLLPKGGLPSENIISDIIDSIATQRV